MHEFQIKFSKNKKHFNKVENALVKSNYQTSKNEMLQPNIYNHPEKYEGYYVFHNNKIIGGIGFYKDYYNWLYVDTLYISPEYRHQNFGTKLIAHAIEYAKQNNMHGILLETWDFQARPFYEKNGFKLYGELKNHPKGQIEYFLKIDFSLDQ